ncbi:hypothetical protein [Halovivax limisalsi]|uniref:hypothetical protein n=1 Tax=Halovivax limisalsi TaxID=1453760 RepID=UPI001FFD9A0B|nr:hypothetical protein [Halovivax limisalsi]
MGADADSGDSRDPAPGGVAPTDDAGPLVRGREWFLLDGDRLVVATLLSVAIFLSVLVLEAVGIISFTNANSMTRVASGMIAGTFSLVTLVVSINQLILSREFVAAGTAEDRLEGVESFREQVATLASAPAAPAAPAQLLELLAETIARRATALESMVDGADAVVRTPIRRYVAELTRETDQLDDALDRTSFSSFDALSLSARFDDDWFRYAGSYLRAAHDEALSDDATAAFDDVLTGLRLFAVAREHFMTTYLQRELTRFSQLTIVVGVPSILSAVLLGFFYADITGPTVSFGVFPYVVSTVVAIVFAPVSLLVAYILRTATITRRTASTGPMMPTKDPDEGPFDVTESDGGRDR